VPHARLRTLAAALAVLALPACSGGDGPAVSSGDPATCPGEVVEVTVSVGQWSDIARRLGGACATVTTVVAAPPEDDAEPVDADLTTLTGADLVLLNGAGYDEWATAAVRTDEDDPVVVSAAEIALTASPEPDGDPHLWCDPVVVPAVAAALAAELGRLSPDAAPYFEAQHATWVAELQPYLEAVAALRAEAEGRRYAATGPVVDRLAAAVGLVDATPPGDVAALESALREGEIDVLLLAGEDGGVAGDRAREAAEDADVPVVDVTEFPEDDTSFVDWQTAQLADLASALTQPS
jgi:zinc/manganese transport system substrate-binding protein